MIDELYLYSCANDLIKAHAERKALGPSPLREAATFPPQAGHVLVDLFFIHGGPGGCIKAPRQSAGSNLSAHQ